MVRTAMDAWLLQRQPWTTCVDHLRPGTQHSHRCDSLGVNRYRNLLERLHGGGGRCGRTGGTGGHRRIGAVSVARGSHWGMAVLHIEHEISDLDTWLEA